MPLKHKGFEQNSSSVRSVVLGFFPETITKILDHSPFSKLRKRPKLFFKEDDARQWRITF